MRVLVLLTIILSGFTSMAFAEVNCQQIQDWIEFKIKVAALINAEGIGDNSIPRLTLKEMKLNNELQIISMNLALLSQNNCPARATLINPGVYMLAAMHCTTARMTGRDEKSACDVDSWKRTEMKS